MEGRKLCNIYYKKPGKCTWKIRSRSGKSQGEKKFKVCGNSVIVKGDDRGDLAPTKRFCGFDSRLLLGPVIPKTLKIGVVPA